MFILPNILPWLSLLHFQKLVSFDEDLMKISSDDDDDEDFIFHNQIWPPSRVKECGSTFQYHIRQYLINQLTSYLDPIYTAFCY